MCFTDAWHKRPRIRGDSSFANVLTNTFKYDVRLYRNVLSVVKYKKINILKY